MAGTWRRVTGALWRAPRDPSIHGDATIDHRAIAGLVGLVGLVGGRLVRAFQEALTDRELLASFLPGEVAEPVDGTAIARGAS